MRRAEIVIRPLLALGGLLAVAGVYATLPPESEPLDIGSRERLLVVAPHPDDETLGAGGLIRRVLDRGGSVHVVLVTAGDANVSGVVQQTGARQPAPPQFVAYGARRIAEARDAVRALGGGRVGLSVLGFPDGELDPLLTAHWQRSRPARSATTGASDPPYADAVDPDVAYDGADLLAELQRLLDATRPTLIALPDPLDAHRDHAAAAVFTILAVDAAHDGPAPRLLAYLIHWPDWPPGWDGSIPAAAGSTLALDLPSTLPARPLRRTALALTPAELDAKRTALARHDSQQQVMGPYLAAFLRHTEPFTELSAGEVRHIARAYGDR